MAQIVLIGPIGAGKSTVAELLADRTGLRTVPLDLVRWGYYFKIGYDLLEERRRVRERGPMARYDYWKAFEVHAVERVLVDYPDAVIDFGAGHSVYDDAGHFARARAALAPVPHVILLLPSADPEQSLRSLTERLAAPPEEEAELAELNRGFLTNPSNARLSTATVYTEGRTPEQTCEDVLALVAAGRR